MTWLSEDPLQEAFGSRALLLSSYGGADFGECAETVRRVAGGGVDFWHREWRATADALVSDADESAAAGHRVSAREAYLRACTYYRTSYMPLFGARQTSRCGTRSRARPLRSRRRSRCGRRWSSPSRSRSRTVRRSLGCSPCGGDSRRPRATIVHVNGYDSNSHEMFVAHVSAALRRGYNVLLFDGPGQGRTLIRDGVPMRPDWEKRRSPTVSAKTASPTWTATCVPRTRTRCFAGVCCNEVSGSMASRACSSTWSTSRATSSRRSRARSRAPTLITAAEGDPIAAGAPCSTTRSPHDTRPCCGSRRPRARAACGSEGRRRFHQRCYDWLDDVLAPTAER